MDRDKGPSGATLDTSRAKDIVAQRYEYGMQQRRAAGPRARARQHGGDGRAVDRRQLLIAQQLLHAPATGPPMEV